MRDRLLAALRAGGGACDPGALLVQAGVFATPPAAEMAQRLVASALAGDERVTVEPGMVRLLHLAPAPVFAVVAIVAETQGDDGDAGDGGAAGDGGEARDGGDYGDGSGRADGGPAGGDRRSERRLQGAPLARALPPAPAEPPGPPVLAGFKVRGAAVDEVDEPIGPFALEAERAAAVEAWLARCVLVAHRAERAARALAEAGVESPPETISLRALARRVLPGLRAASLDALCVALDVAPEREDAPLARAPARDQARALADALTELYRRAAAVPGLLRGGAAGLAEASRAPRPPRRAAGAFDFEGRALTPRKLATAPEAPGVYRFLDAEGDVVYVGASEDLRRRLAEHFGGAPSDHSRRLVAHVHDVDWEEHASPLEAFLRELELIQTLAPRLNRRGGGLAAAVYLRVAGKRAPRLVAAKRPPARGRTFGPFTFAGGARKAVANLRAAFAGAEDRLERFLETGDLRLAPRRDPEVLAIAAARAAVRGEWEAGTRAVLVPGGALLLLHGAAEAELLAEPSPALAAERLAARAHMPTVSGEAAPPDHVDPATAARALLVRRWARDLPQTRLDTLADLEAVRAAVATLLAPP